MRILFLDLDTLRQDHLGCYGYYRNTSPNIDEVAKDGIKFTNYYCSDAPCLPSRTALMSGRFGIHNGVVNHGGTAADIRIDGPNRGFQDTLAKESLPGFLRSEGFRNILISPFAERHSSWSFYAGFHEMYDTGGGGTEPAEVITPYAEKWLNNNCDKDNWFLHVNYWDAHTPYRAPEDFGNPFEDSPLEDWYTDELIERHRRKIGPHSMSEINMYDNIADARYPRYLEEVKDRNDLKHLVDGYDCGIRYMDSHIGRILNILKEHKVYDDVMIIVSADHGENMGELGIYSEHATADNGTCHIPMIIKYPGGSKNVQDDGLHYNIDLLPTLAELLNAKPCKSWDGRSYAGSITGGLDTGRPELIVSQCAHVCQRGVRFQNYMYIRTYHDGYHLFDKEMLFDLDKDPHEQKNIAGENPSIVKEAVYRLYNWHDDMMFSMPNPVDPLWTVISEGGPHHTRGFLRKYIKRLEETGRGYGIEELKRRHPEEFTR